MGDVWGMSFCFLSKGVHLNFLWSKRYFDTAILRGHTAKFTFVEHRTDPQALKYYQNDAESESIKQKLVYRFWVLAFTFSNTLGAGWSWVCISLHRFFFLYRVLREVPLIQNHLGTQFVSLFWSLQGNFSKNPQGQYRIFVFWLGKVVETQFWA